MLTNFNTTSQASVAIHIKGWWAANLLAVVALDEECNKE